MENFHIAAAATFSWGRVDKHDKKKKMTQDLKFSDRQKSICQSDVQLL